jgi:uncharacterized protein DUF3800
MYLLFVDESGTHGGSHAFVLGGLAVHEQDAQPLQRAWNECVHRHLPMAQAEDYELHATELRNAKKPKSGSRVVPSPWAFVERHERLAILESAYDVFRSFTPSDARLPIALFGVVIDRRFHSEWTVFERERFAYEVMLNKFDVMLKRIRSHTSLDNRGLVIHDRRVVAERDIQEWTREWQRAAGTIGQLRNLADVPLFADSRATRLVQAADLVSYALYRHYDPAPPRVDYAEKIWEVFDSDGEALHGAVHFTPSFVGGNCNCLPCAGRRAVLTAARVPSSRQEATPLHVTVGASELKRERALADLQRIAAKGGFDFSRADELDR